MGHRRTRVLRVLASTLGLVVLLIGIGAAVRTESETTSAAEPKSERIVLTKTFVSPRNAFSIKHPDTVAVTPAKQPWGLSGQMDDGFDVVETGAAAVFRGASTRIPSGFPGDDAWIDDMTDRLPGGCRVPRSQQAEITIDGQSGRISECPDGIVATVVAGGRLYLFTLLHNRIDARAVFDAFVATIDLRPEDAAVRSDAEAGRPPTTSQQVETQPPAQPAVNIAKFRAAFMKAFGNPDDEVLGYGHITGVRLSRGRLEITTDLDPEGDVYDSTVRTICLDALGFAFNEGLDGVETGVVIGSDGAALGQCA